MQAVGQDVEAAEYILAAMPKALVPGLLPGSTFSPTDPDCLQPRRAGLRRPGSRGYEADPGEWRHQSQSLGTFRVIDVDTVIFCIGDKVDDSFGLPVQWNAFVKNASPLCPIDEISFEVFDHENALPIPGIFVAGWSREASSGLVGVARAKMVNGGQKLSSNT